MSAPPVIRIRSDLGDYVTEQAGRLGMPVSDFVNAAVEALRCLDARHRIGFDPGVEQVLRKQKNKWVALLVCAPGQPTVLAAGELKQIHPTSISLELPLAPGAIQMYDVPRAWIEAVYPVNEQPRFDLPRIAESLEPWAVGVHHLTAAYLRSQGRSAFAKE